MYDARTNLGAEVVEEVRKYFREKSMIRLFQEMSVYPKHQVMVYQSLTMIFALKRCRSVSSTSKGSVGE